MIQQDVAKRCQVEYERLQTVKGALRLTLQWRTPAVGLPKKMETLLFIMRALQRHLELQLRLEEQDGYLEIVNEYKPNLFDRKEQLRGQHDYFRNLLEQMLPNLERLSTANMEEVEAICMELSDLLEQLDAHEHSETKLLLEAVGSDEGGEG